MPSDPGKAGAASQHARQIEGAEQHVLAERWKAPEGLPGVGEDVVLEEDAVLQAGGHADVAAHDVDAVVVQRARQVQTRLGGVLLQLQPLARADVVRLHLEQTRQSVVQSDKQAWELTHTTAQEAVWHYLAL